MNSQHIAAGMLAAASAAAAQAQIQITEWMYNGVNATGEYVELTNIGSSAIDTTGWSFDDASRTAGSFLLSFGVVGAGESVLLTEAAAADFRSAWALGAGVKVAGGNAHNLGRDDEINLYDAGGALVDRLTYGDQTLLGTVRAINRSGNPGSLADLQPQAVTSSWLLASAGDAYGSYVATTGDIGNPGRLALLPVPETSTWAMMLVGGVLLSLRLRRATAS